MAENTTQEKSEQPTEKKLRDSRKEGQVARSKELNTAVLLMLGTAGLLWFSGMFFSLFYNLVRKNFQFDHTSLSNDKMMQIALGDAFLSMLGAIFPFLFMLFISLWISGSLPGGFHVSAKVVAPKLSKLSPIKGLGRMFGPEALMELAKSMVKIFLIGCCLYGFMTQLWDRLLFLQRVTLTQALIDGLGILSLCLMILVSLLLLVAVIDVPWQQHRTSKKIKMTKQEVKEERKSTDGSPELKSRIRQIQYQMANRRIEERVPQADVIVTNPTHYAIALRYSEKNAKAPYVVAKGIDEMALRIRAVAKRSQLEIVEIPVLARAIYYSTRVDQEIPRGLYTAVAYVLTYVMQLKAYKSGRGNKPAPIPALDIPTSLLNKANVRGS